MSEEDKVFQVAADLFSVLATPIRLKIIGSICNEEKNVSQLLEEISTTQPNMSQHLSSLFKAGIISKRREGTQIFYKVCNDEVAVICRTVVNSAAIKA